MTDIGETPKPSEVKKFSRRDFLKIGGSAAAGAGIEAKFHPIGSLSKLFKDALNRPRYADFSPVNIADIKFPELPNFKEAEGWDTDLLKRELEKAVQSSIETASEALLELPEGEILVDKVISVVIPKEAKIKITGNKNGSSLKLEESLSHLPSEHNSFAENSLLFFKDMEGELSIENVHFDGGSKIAGKGGYKAPPSPWNSILFVDGKGPGDHFDPVMEQAVNRRGKVNIANCTFQNSESGGALVQNLSEVNISSCHGINLDALLVVAWSNRILSKNMYAENCLSDGAYINDAKDVQLTDWVIKRARQGYEIQGGVDHAVLERCQAVDCAVGYVFMESETDKTPSQKITLKNSDSNDCLTIFSIGNVRSLDIQNCRNDGAGGWFKGYQARDFMHIGVANLGGLSTASIIDWGPPGRKISFKNVELRQSESAPSGYKLVSKDGVKNYSLE